MYPLWNLNKSNQWIDFFIDLIKHVKKISQIIFSWEGWTEISSFSHLEKCPAEWVGREP